jgi:hypothetical protein
MTNKTAQDARAFEFRIPSQIRKKGGSQKNSKDGIQKLYKQ